MSAVRYYCAMSLDGFIAESDDTLDWLRKYEGTYDAVEAGEGSGYERFYQQVGALVMGSVTYEWILAELEDWPYAGKPVWVLSSRDLPLPEGDADVRIAAAPVPELFDQMLGTAGARDLWVVGGGNVASQFADHGLLDQVEVTVVPVVLGAGKPLFDRPLPGGPMRLLDIRATPSGMVEVRYEVIRR